MKKILVLLVLCAGVTSAQLSKKAYSIDLTARNSISALSSAAYPSQITNGHFLFLKTDTLRDGTFGNGFSMSSNGVVTASASYGITVDALNGFHLTGITSTPLSDGFYSYHNGAWGMYTAGNLLDTTEVGFLDKTNIWTGISNQFVNYPKLDSGLAFAPRMGGFGGEKPTLYLRAPSVSQDEATTFELPDDDGGTFMLASQFWSNNNRAADTMRVKVLIHDSLDVHRAEGGTTLAEGEGITIVEEGGVSTISTNITAGDGIQSSVAGGQITMTVTPKAGKGLAISADSLAIDSSMVVTHTQMNALTFGDSTAVRVLNTTYTNSTGHILFVAVSLDDGSNDLTFTGQIGPSTANLVMAQVAAFGSSLGVSTGIFLSFYVPTGYKYLAGDGAVGGQIVKWIEYKLPN